LFSNPRFRQINNVKTKPSLLEAIIRIRLDKLSGTADFSGVNNADSESLINTDINFLDEDVAVTTDSFGPLEALFVIRLRSALAGLAKKMVLDIDSAIQEMERSSEVPSPVTERTSGGSENQHDQSAVVFKTVTITKEEAKKESLENQKLIEDSLLSLLGDNSEALDLQYQTQRNSSVYDSHLMGGLISIVDVPRKRIEAELKTISNKKKELAEARTDKDRESINKNLGIDIGVGVIDMVVFSLALFTMSEEGLLGLLSDKEFEKLKNGPFSEVLPGTGDKDQILSAVNELSSLIKQGYDIFISELKSLFQEIA